MGRVDDGVSRVHALIGRDEQLGQLRAALEQAAAGTPRVMIVEAEPGMGKSALLDAFAQTRTDSHRLLRAACDPYEIDVPFGALSMILEDLPDPETAPIAAGTRLLRLLGELQQRGGAVLMILDDIQWMDPQSSDAIRFALRRLRADRVLTVLARRPVIGTDPWAGLVGDVQVSVPIDLSPLSTDSIVALALADRDWHLDQATAERVRQHTGGLPLLVHTFLLGASEDDVTRADGSLPVPSSSAAAVERILQTIDADARNLVRALAVLDEPTALIPLASVAGVHDITQAFAAAIGTRLIELDGGADPAQVRLAHDLLRVAVYEGMSPETRRLMHQRAAGLSTGTRSLRHRVAAADRPDAELAETLMSTALEDAQQGRESLAATRLLQARAVTADPAGRDELLLRAMVYRVRAGDLSGADALRAGAEECPPSGRRSHALGLLMRESGRMSEAVQLLGDAYERAVAEGATRGAELVSVDLASAYATTGRWDETLEAASRGITSADPWVVRTSRWHRALALRPTDLGAALAELDVVPKASEASPDDADSLAVRAALRMSAGNLAGAEDDLDGAIRFAGSGRRLVALNRIFVQRCNVRFYRGDWDEAAVDAANARALATAGEIPWDVPIAHSISVTVPAGRGEWDVAEEHLARARSTAEQLGEVAIVTTFASAIFLATARLDHEELLRLVTPQVDVLLEESPSARQAPRWFFPGAITALVHAGRAADAHRVLLRYEASEVVRHNGSGLTQIDMLRGMVAEARGEPDVASASYATGLADPTITDVPLSHAMLLMAAGRLARSLGSRRDAVQHLRRAREILVRLRASPYLERCDAELAASGLPQAEGGRVERGPLALTPREQDVATLVARGLTNAEAAGSLFVTGKTIEYHLGNVYAKLGIASRRELRTLLSA